jgi:hypothetical protein
MPHTGSHGLFASVGVATNDRCLAEGSIQDQIRVVTQKLTLGPVHSIAGWCVTPTYAHVDKWAPGEGFDVGIDQALAQIVQMRLAPVTFCATALRATYQPFRYRHCEVNDRVQQIRSDRCVVKPS